MAKKKAAKKQVKKQTCAWCKFNQYGCDAKDCDFLALPYEKDAIIQRVKEERQALRELKKKFIEGELIDPADAEVEMGKAVDISKGIQIMVARLQEDFDVDFKQLKEILGDDEEQTFGQRMRLMAAMARLKRRRQNGK